MLDQKREINIKLRFELSAAWVWKIQLWDLPGQQCRNYRVLIYSNQESGPWVPLHLGHLLTGSAEATCPALRGEGLGSVSGRYSLTGLRKASSGIRKRGALLVGLDLEQQRHTSEHPLGRLVFSFKVESPDVGWASLAGFVDRTRVHTTDVLLVSWNGFDENDGHGRGQLLEPGVCDYPGLQREEDKVVVRFPRHPPALPQYARSL